MKSNKLKVLAFAKFQAMMTGLLGVIFAVIYAIGGFIIDVMVSAELLSPVVYNTTGLSYGTVLAFAALIGMPVIFAIFGFVAGLLEAVLFNRFVARFDALSVDFWR